MYCLENEYFDKVKEDIKFDSVFDNDVTNEPLPTSAQVQPHSEQPVNDKRSKLLLKKLASYANSHVNTFEMRLNSEIERS